MSLSSSFLFLQASQTLGAGNASNSPRQTRGERNSRWRWEPFGKRQLSIPSPQSLLLLPPAPELPEHFVAPYPAADPLQGSRWAFKVTPRPKVFVLTGEKSARGVGREVETRHTALQLRAIATTLSQGDRPSGCRAAPVPNPRPFL